MPIPPFDSTGFLPPGCHRTGRPEVKAALVDDFPSSEQRPRLHNAWLDLWDSLHEILPVPRSWLGGSFVSDKANPDDIDTCWFLDGQALEDLPEPRQRAVRILADTALSRIKWQCDSHAIVEYPPEHPGHASYLEAAVYWHNHWGHTRSEPGVLTNARGYVEVS